MEFKTPDLVEAAWGESESLEVLSDKILCNTRWSEVHELIFRFDDRIYRTKYSQGLTENQCESPFDNEGPTVDCEEVREVLKTVKSYVPVCSSENMLEGYCQCGCNPNNPCNIVDCGHHAG